MATSYKIQRKTTTGVEDIKIDAATLDGKDSSYYLNYNNLTNKPTISSGGAVTDLGTITESPTSATNSVLNAATKKGLYAFKWSTTTPTRILQCYMEVSSVMDWVYQLITIFAPAETQFTEKKISRYYYSGSWQINTNAFFTVLANKQLGTSGQVLMSDGSKAYWGTPTSASGFLPKTTYEWNKEIAFSNTGKLCIGKFPMYDSNLTVEIKATTSKTYSAILVIATQNVKNTQLGTLTANVYGDPNNDVGKNIYIEHVSGSNMIGVYFSPEARSKNLIHIQAVALNTNANYGSTAATDICTNVASIPTPATKQPTNALKQEYDVAKNISSSLNTAGVVNADGTLKAKYDGNGNQINTTYATQKMLTDLIGGAPEAYNTLKEIADYINEDKTGASSMLASITKNSNDIAELDQKIADVESNIAKEIAEALAGEY